MNKTNGSGSNAVKKWINHNVIVFAFLGIFVIFSIISPTFLNVDNLLNITRQISLDGGYIVEQGAPKDVLEHPKEARTQDFLSKVLI